MDVTPTSTWQEYSLTFTAVAGDVGQPFQPAFLGAANVYFGIDNVPLDAVRRNRRCLCCCLAQAR